MADVGHASAEPAEAKEPERHAFKINADGRLPGRAGLEPRVLVTDVTREFEHQSGGDGRGGIAEARRAADDDTLRFGSFEIDRGIAHAGGDQKFEIGQGFDHGTRKGGALAHGADNGIVFERRYDLVRGAKMLIERLDLDVACDSRPISHLQRDVLVIVKNCAAKRHEFLGSVGERHEGYEPGNLQPLLACVLGLSGSGFRSHDAEMSSR